MNEPTGWNTEVSTGRRFRFGENWKRLIADVDSARVAAAMEGISAILGLSDLAGMTFLDVGCGSGLSSLAARNLGASVHAFDFDPESIEAAGILRERMRPSDEQWVIERGSVLDTDYLAGLGTFDVVYSWGVLHHTGAMWQAIENISPLVAPGGLLALALYNDQARKSRSALAMKERYVHSGSLVRSAMLGYQTSRFYARRFLVDLRDRRNPLRRHEPPGRGMSIRRDIVDWVGGYPFEVAKPEDVLAAIRPRGFELVWMKTVGGGSGNNEYRFQRATGMESRLAPLLRR